MFTKAAADDCRQPQQEAQADGYGFDSIHNALQLLPSIAILKNPVNNHQQ